ncbi:MAG: F0F1 ATP synthase subunit gamma, partial [Chloroflexi bacterium]|nr:F0F1 ATP synthase subunit gamma [Chloroflexota bacterium]
MPSLKDIRDRIRSVSNTAKITSAMQLIAASRMQRAQQMVRNGRPYADQMQEVLSHLTTRLTEDDETLDPLLQRRPNNRELLVLITPDRGLAGALVGNILRAAAQEITSSDVPIDTVGIGRKGERFIARTGQSLIATFSVGDRPALADTLDISSFVIDRYRDGDADTVKMIYAQFV